MIFLFAGLLLVFVGYLIRFRHVYWLIKGYLLMPIEEKQSYDIDELSRFVGNLYFLLAPIFFVLGGWTLAGLPGITLLTYAALTIAIVSAIAARLYIQKATRFRH